MVRSENERLASKGNFGFYERVGSVHSNEDEERVMSNTFDPRSGPQGPAAPTAAAYPEQGYRAPPAGPWGTSAAAFQAAYAPAAAVPQAASNSIYGDGAGEYLRMERGRYGAWAHVAVGFLYQVGLIGSIVGFPAAFIAALVTNDAGTIGLIAMISGGLFGAVGAYFTFRDRWKCIEAFSSRFCIGLMNISILYVPLIAFVYANVRGIQKLAGK